MTMSPNKYCFALDLKDDPDLIAQYKSHHENIWQEVRASIVLSGITGMEIFHCGNRLFMIMEVKANFSFEKKARIDSESLRVQEWEAMMSSFQQTLPFARAGEKWVLMDKIFEL